MKYLIKIFIDFHPGASSHPKDEEEPEGSMHPMDKEDEEKVRGGDLKGFGVHKRSTVQEFPSTVPAAICPRARAVRRNTRFRGRTSVR